MKNGKRKRAAELPRDRKGPEYEQKILRAWQCGKRTPGEIMSITGIGMEVINKVLPVEDIEKMEVLRRYGYGKG